MCARYTLRYASGLFSARSKADIGFSSQCSLFGYTYLQGSAALRWLCLATIDPLFAAVRLPTYPRSRNCNIDAIVSSSFIDFPFPLVDFNWFYYFGSYPEAFVAAFVVKRVSTILEQLTELSMIDLLF